MGFLSSLLRHNVPVSASWGFQRHAPVSQICKAATLSSVRTLDFTRWDVQVSTDASFRRNVLLAALSLSNASVL